MFDRSPILPGAAAKGSPIDAIAQSVRRLELPSPALYHQAGQERRRVMGEASAAIDAAMHEATREQLAAVERLHALDETAQPDTGNYIDQIVCGKKSGRRAALGGKRLTRQEIAECEAMAKPHVAMATRLRLLAFYIATAFALLAIIGIVDIALLWQAFDYLTGGHAVATAVLSTAGILCLAAFHCEATHAPDAAPIRALRTLSPWLIATYAVGAGIAVAAILYANGGSSLADNELNVDFLGDAAVAPESSLLERLMAHVGGLGFSLACGGVVIVNMMLAHRLLTSAGENLREFTEKRSKARAAKSEIELVRTCDTAINALLVECQNELARLGSPESQATDVTYEILATIARGREPYETWLTDRDVRTTQEPQSRFAGIRDDLKPAEIRRRVEALRAITFDDVYPYVCDEHPRTAKPIATGVPHETVH